MTAPRIPPALLLAVLATAALAYSFMQTVVLPALPAFAEAFDASTTSAAWVSSAFFLSSSICIPIVGRLGDALGKVRVLTWAMAVLGLATLAAAMAPDLPTLIACRVVQGVGGAVFPLAFGIVSDELPAHRTGLGIGIISSVFGIGSGVGYVVSGVVLELASWRWLFVVALVPIVAAVAFLPRIPDSPVRAPARPDLAGGALLSTGLLAALVAVSEGNRWGWGSPPFLALLATGFALLAAWTRVERRVPDPMVDMAMFFRRSMVWLNATTFLIGYAMFTTFTVLAGLVSADPREVGYGFSASPIEVGVFFMPVAVTMLVTGPLAGGARRPEPVTVLRVGVAFLVASLVLIAATLEHRWGIYVGTGLLGAGCATCLAVLGRLVVEAVEQNQTGIAGAMNTIMRTIGGAVAGQASAAIVSGFMLSSGVPAERGYRLAFAAAALGAVAALACTLALPSRARGR